MTVRAHFARDYAEARGKFGEAAQAAGARVARYVDNQAEGPDGAALSIDTAWLGPEDAPAVLVTVSATHGAEGFCGAGVQTGRLATGVAGELPRGTALFQIHGVNPYGFAWLRRVTEENVDLNRNFIAHAGELPRNRGYAELADALCPTRWSEAVQAETQAILAEYGRRHGAAFLQHAISGGQYSHPDGIFYGGTGPTWSHRALLGIARAQLGRARRIAVIDYHTGLGPYGHGEKIIVHRQKSAGLARARAWYGEDVTSTALGTSQSADVVGDLLTGIEATLPLAEVTGMALEYGVRSVEAAVDAVRADNWLHHHGNLDSVQGRTIKAQMRTAFYGDADDWKEMIFEQAVDAERRALKGLVG